MNVMLQDMRYALRQLCKNPGFAAVIILTLAVGIGANTAIFSTVSALVLHPQPFPDIERLLLLREGRFGQADEEKTFAPADFFDLASRAKSFEGLAAFRYANFNLTTPDRALAVEGAMVTANCFSLLGSNAAIGRTFNSGEDQPGQDQEVLISHRYWTANLASDRNIVGQELLINGRKHTVVGVMPAGFNYPIGIDMWTPLALTPAQWADRETTMLHVVGKLKSGVSLGRALAEMKNIAAGLATEFPRTNSSREITLLRLREEQYQYTLPMFLTLQAAGAFVLLLICANLTGLLFSRFIARQREIAVRSALGANWMQLAKVFLGENLLLSALAGGMAIAVAFWCVNVIRTGIPIGISKWIAGWEHMHVDASALTLALLLTILLGLVFGIVLARHAARINPNRALKEGTGGSATSGGKERLRSILLVTQVVLAMVLLAGAGTMAKAFLQLASVYQGLQPEHVATMQIALPSESYSDGQKVSSFYSQFLLAAGALPGVESVGVADNIPASNVDNSTTPFTVRGRPALREGEIPSADLESISANFLSALKVRLIEGREISDADTKDAPRIAVISRAMAERFWTKQSPIGQQFKLGAIAADLPWITVAGVVDNVKQNWWDPEGRSIIYVPYKQSPQRAMNVVVRTSSEPDSVMSGLRGVVRKLDPAVALTSEQGLKAVIADSLSPIRIIGILMDIFGALALALSALGVFGVLAQGVAQRTREFGIQVALGATRTDVLKFVLKQALRPTAIGLAVALPLSFALTHAMTKMMFGIGALNWSILVGFSAVLMLAALAAAYIPARRAASVDPMVALRYE
jgi:predicted permease